MRISDWSSDVCSSDLWSEMVSCRTKWPRALRSMIQRSQPWQIYKSGVTRSSRIERCDTPSPAAACHGPVRLRPLNRRAWDIAERAEHAAVAGQGPQHRRAMPAIIEELAGVGGHRLGRDTAALGTGQRGGELHQESAFISGASMRSHISAVRVRADR